MAERLHVELVAADRTVWSGEATIVIARTTEGEIGILPGHMPVMSLLVDGIVEIRTPEGEYCVAAADSGFLSVAHDRVSILAEHAEMSSEIDIAQAKRDLERAHEAGEGDDPEQRAAIRRAEARIRAFERAS
ncbi:MAG: F0F1 ATP synthase subunit epsilon [Propionibacteriales bacterium]|nr:F0F1 ATP synthase subunit epsilon [Propionibacteriales bacterium]